MPRVVGSLLLAIALAAAGGIVWSALFRANLQLAPSVPWSVATMALLGVVCWHSLSRTKVGGQLLRPPENWRRASLAAVLAATCSTSAVLIGLRLGNFPEGAFASDIVMDRLPLHMRVVRVLGAALVAAVFEEIGFRGFLLDALLRRFGPVTAILGTTFFFYALHLGHDWSRGDVKTVLAIAIPFLISGIGFAALTIVCHSLIPAIGMHALIDLALLPLEWTGRHNLDPVSRTGLDVHFSLCALAFALSLPLTVLALVRLLRNSISAAAAVNSGHRGLERGSRSDSRGRRCSRRRRPALARRDPIR